MERVLHEWYVVEAGDGANRSSYRTAAGDEPLAVGAQPR
jgi:hypothetical protein